VAQRSGAIPNGRKIPGAAVARLPLYYRALLEVAEGDVDTVSSERLAVLAGVNAAQVRKDLSYLGSYVTRGVGYEVAFLIDRISRELGLTHDWPVVIVGVGNLGHALANYRGLGARGFRVLALVDTDRAGLPLPVAHIARDPLDPEFDDAGFAAALRRRRTGLKRALLDQTLVSGIGNIYADEALWRARLHWARPTSTMTRARSAEVLAAARAVMVEALDHGGTSFDSLYVNVNGESGYFDRELAVYGRTGLPCRRCGALVVREHFMNRSSFRCPRCQRRPRDAHG